MSSLLIAVFNVFALLLLLQDASAAAKAMGGGGGGGMQQKRNNNNKPQPSARSRPLMLFRATRPSEKHSLLVTAKKTTTKSTLQAQKHPACSIDCQNGATCVRKLDASWTCDCAHGWTGHDCSVPTFEACRQPHDRPTTTTTIGCYHGGRCLSAADAEDDVCDCSFANLQKSTLLFVGRYCEHAVRLSSSCEGYCVNGGTCEVATADETAIHLSCVCPEPYVGTHCELKHEDSSMPEEDDDDESDEDPVFAKEERKLQESPAPSQSPYPSGTWYPTDTWYPSSSWGPTSTPAPSSTWYPTATSYPSSTSYPSQTSYPTQTWYPTYTVTVYPTVGESSVATAASLPPVPAAANGLPPSWFSPTITPGSDLPPSFNLGSDLPPSFTAPTITPGSDLPPSLNIQGPDLPPAFTAPTITPGSNLPPAFTAPTVAPKNELPPAFTAPTVTPGKDLPPSWFAPTPSPTVTVSPSVTSRPTPVSRSYEDGSSPAPTPEPSATAHPTSSTKKPTVNPTVSPSPSPRPTPEPSVTAQPTSSTKQPTQSPSKSPAPTAKTTPKPSLSFPAPDLTLVGPSPPPSIRLNSSLAPSSSRRTLPPGTNLRSSDGDVTSDADSSPTPSPTAATATGTNYTRLILVAAGSSMALMIFAGLLFAGMYNLCLRRRRRAPRQPTAHSAETADLRANVV